MKDPRDPDRWNPQKVGYEENMDRARHKARKAFGREKIVVSPSTSEQYRQNYDQIDWGHNERSKP